MKLINILAYYRCAPWAVYIANAASEEELYTELQDFSLSQICHYADMVAIQVDQTMTPFTLKNLLHNAAQNLTQL